MFFAGSRGASVYKSQPNLVADVPYSHLPTSVTEPQNYPNPFSTSTKIEFTVKTNGFVKVALYDMMGRQLQVLYSGQAEVGKHSMTFEAGSFLSNGKYLIVVQNANLTSSHWMTVTK